MCNGLAAICASEMCQLHYFAEARPQRGEEGAALALDVETLAAEQRRIDTRQMRVANALGQLQDGYGRRKVVSELRRGRITRGGDPAGAAGLFQALDLAHKSRPAPHLRGRVLRLRQDHERPNGMPIEERRQE